MDWIKHVIAKFDPRGGRLKGELVSLRNFCFAHYKDALLVVVSTVVALIALEIVLHFTPLRLPITRSPEPQGYVRYDEELGVDLTPSFATSTHTFYDTSYDVWTNAYGCFDTEIAQDEKPYALLVGDSFTWGYTPFEHKWGTQLESLLKKRVLKCGVNGYGTEQERVKAGRVLAQLERNRIPKPSVLLVGHFGWNDVEDDSLNPNSVVAHGYRMKNFGPEARDEAVRNHAYEIAERYCIGRNDANTTFVQAVKCYLSRNSVLYVTLKDNAKKVVTALVPDRLLNMLGLVLVEKTAASDTPRAESQSDRGEFEAHAKQIIAMKAFAREHKMRLIFVLIPSREEARTYTDEQFAQSNNEKSKAVMKEHNIEFIDLTQTFRSAEKQFPKPHFYWSGDTHWNPAGNAFAATLIADYLREHEK